MKKFGYVFLLIFIFTSCSHHKNSFPKEIKIVRPAIKKKPENDETKKGCKGCILSPGCFTWWSWN